MLESVDLPFPSNAAFSKSRSSDSAFSLSSGASADIDLFSSGGGNANPPGTVSSAVGLVGRGVVAVVESIDSTGVVESSEVDSPISLAFGLA